MHLGETGYRGGNEIPKQNINSFPQGLGQTHRSLMTKELSSSGKQVSSRKELPPLPVRHRVLLKGPKDYQVSLVLWRLEKS